MKKSLVFLLLAVLAFYQAKAQFKFNWAQQLSGANEEFISATTSDNNYNVYLAGYFNSPSLDLDMGTGNAPVTSASSGYDGFVTKYNSNGVYQWGIHLTGTGACLVKGITVDASNNVYITGYFINGNINFNPGVGGTLTASSNVAAFMAKYDATGAYVWAQMMGGNAGDMLSNAITVSSTNIVYGSGNRYCIP